MTVLLLAAAALLSALTFLSVRPSAPWPAGRAGTRWVGAGLWLGLAFGGAALQLTGAARDVGVVLSLAAPALSLLWALGGDLLRHAPRRVWAFAAGAALLGGGLAGALGGLSLAWLLAWPLASLVAVTAALLAAHGVTWERLRWLRAHVRPWVALLVLSALVRIPVPLWPEGFALLATLSTSLLALSALSWAWARVGVRALGLAALAFAIGLGVEVLGSRTGFPFGAYDYDPPGPTVLGVPLLVPLGWWWMSAAALALSGGRPWLAGALLVALDLGLEPLMTRTGFWTWAPGGGAYYGVPWVNFLGWYVVGTFIGWLLARLAPELTRGGFGWAYRVEALMLPAGLLLLGLWPAAVVTFALMGVLAWTSSRPAFAR